MAEKGSLTWVWEEGGINLEGVQNKTKVGPMDRTNCITHFVLGQGIPTDGVQ